MVAAIKKEKLIENSKYPVLARLLVSSMLKIEEEKKAGNDVATLGKSTICGTMAPTELGALRKKDGEEGLGK